MLGTTFWEVDAWMDWGVGVVGKGRKWRAISCRCKVLPMMER